MHSSKLQGFKNLFIKMACKATMVDIERREEERERKQRHNFSRFLNEHFKQTYPIRLLKQTGVYIGLVWTIGEQETNKIIVDHLLALLLAEVKQLFDEGDGDDDTAQKRLEM